MEMYVAQLAIKAHNLINQSELSTESRGVVDSLGTCPPSSKHCACRRSQFFPCVVVRVKRALVHGELIEMLGLVAARALILNPHNSRSSSSLPSAFQSLLSSSFHLRIILLTNSASDSNGVCHNSRVSSHSQITFLYDKVTRPCCALLVPHICILSHSLDAASTSTSITHLSHIRYQSNPFSRSHSPLFNEKELHPSH